VVTYRDCSGKTYVRTSDDSGACYVNPVLADGGVDLSNVIPEGPVLVTVKGAQGTAYIFYQHKYDRTCPATIDGKSTSIPCSADALLYRDEYLAAQPYLTPPPLPADYQGLPLRHATGTSPVGSPDFALHNFAHACADAAAGQN
jgi:hypothetical protein